MPRGLTADQLAANAQKVRAIAYFFEILTPTPIRAWTGVGVTAVLGAVWQGVGEIGVITGLQGARDTSSTPITISLNGIPAQNIAPGAIANTRAQRYQGRELNVYLGFLDLSTGYPLGDPTGVWAGFADVLTFQLGSTVSCSLSTENLASRLRLANGVRMTSASQAQRLGNPATPDLFFEPTTSTMGVARQILA